MITGPTSGIVQIKNILSSEFFDILKQITMVLCKSFYQSN